MKRTLTFWLLLVLAGTAVAQTPTVVEKPSNTTSSAAKPAGKTASATKAVPQTATVKPSPATVKVGGVPAQKTSAPAKPAVVAVQPAKTNAAPVAAAKPMTATNAKVTPVPVTKATSVPAAKTSAAPAGKPVPVPAAKASMAPAAKPAMAVKPAMQPVITAGKPAVTVGTKPVAVGAKGVAAMPTKDPFSKNVPKAGLAKVQAPAPVKAAGTVVAVKDEKAVVDKKPVAKRVDAAGRRDPFLSPVVNMGAVGSGCSTGKRCLAIDQILLRGVVKSDGGMIAVVVNAMDKAYFLRENDPVFDGYVVKITGDSVVFKETFHDKLGKPLTKDVTKTISRPVA